MMMFDSSSTTKRPVLRPPLMHVCLHGPVVYVAAEATALERNKPRRANATERTPSGARGKRCLRSNDEDYVESDAGLYVD